ncbi:MAG: DUF2721 domain-containing protein [Verrucomicrobiales bacterium]
MNLDLTTPGLLFPTISLLLLAYTNRFVALANIVRTLHGHYRANPEPVLLAEIQNLRKRIRLIRDMQALGVLSLLFCAVCMLTLFLGLTGWAEWIFGGALAAMIGSLILSLIEIQMSVGALNLHLRDLAAAQAQRRSSARVGDQP